MPNTFDRPEIREDMVFLRIMRNDFEVFKDLAEDEVRRVVGHAGSVVVACADGDQLYELMTHHRIVCACQRHCHHTPALNGGPLLWSDAVPPEMQHDGEVILRHAFEGKELKGLDTLILYGHAPCGKARSSNISAPEALEHYVRAKDRARRYARDHAIRLTACHLWMHIQWPVERRNTYFFDRRAWGHSETRSFCEGWQKSAALRSKTVQKCWPEFWPALAA